MYDHDPTDPHNYSFASSKSSENNFNAKSYTISLDDLYETISLYEEEGEGEEGNENSRRLTWEEWYLKKKIQALKNEKKMQQKFQRVNSTPK